MLKYAFKDSNTQSILFYYSDIKFLKHYIFENYICFSICIIYINKYLIQQYEHNSHSNQPTKKNTIIEYL